MIAGCDGVFDESMNICKEVRINFPPAQDIAGIARHASWMSIPHPLQVVWIVTASFKLASVPRPKALALSAEHLVAAISLVYRNLAIRAGFSGCLEKSDRSKGVRIANVIVIIVSSLEFPALRAGVFVACGTLPSGRDESIAVGISTAMNELVSGSIIVNGSFP